MYTEKSLIVHVLVRRINKNGVSRQKIHHIKHSVQLCLSQKIFRLFVRHVPFLIPNIFDIGIQWIVLVRLCKNLSSYFRKFKRAISKYANYNNLEQLSFNLKNTVKIMYTVTLDRLINVLLLIIFHYCNNITDNAQLSHGFNYLGMSTML